MKKNYLILMTVAVVFGAIVSFRQNTAAGNYMEHYTSKINEFESSLKELRRLIGDSDPGKEEDHEKISGQIAASRLKLKGMDFWLRYLEPISYKRINGPLPVEWETEVFEKFEAPYKREGAGLTLAALYLDEEKPDKDSLMHLIDWAIRSMEPYRADSIMIHLKTKDHFFLCNRLFLLNLAAIYTTGFECPDTSQIIPELRAMLSDVYGIYSVFNKQFPENTLPENYLSLYREAVGFVSRQSNNYLAFDHFTFIRNYINPLFSLNQKLIRDYSVVSKSYVDYSLSKTSASIFNKDLYAAQNTKGIFLRVYDKDVLSEIDRLGKLLFYDPILSGNNLRSCASCHNPQQFFTDTVVSTALQFDRTAPLPRNAPTLVNAQYNHLIMLDGKHISLQNQTKDVITNALEMNCSEKEVLEKILSCQEYKTGFKKLLKYTPQEPEITLEHITSAITFYYGKFGRSYSPFDLAMNQAEPLEEASKKGFNVFMGKAQCATCHFVPQFNGVKPPYVSSEFEVLGVPRDTLFKALSPDRGRDGINPAAETRNAFRTGTVRNAARTMPYMHNGSIRSLNQLIDFYDGGGGAGRGLPVSNQTLSSDSLHLNKDDKRFLLAFISSLNEKVAADEAPEKLPSSKNKTLNKRKPGGEY